MIKFLLVFIVSFIVIYLGGLAIKVNVDTFYQLVGSVIVGLLGTSIWRD